MPRLLPWRRRHVSHASARIIHFALLAETHRGETWYRPVALYGFAVDTRWTTGAFAGELIDALHVADLGGRYQLLLQPGTRLPVRYDARHPEHNRLQLVSRRRLARQGLWRRLLLRVLIKRPRRAPGAGS